MNVKDDLNIESDKILSEEGFESILKEGMDEICKVQKQSLEGCVSRTLGGTDTGLTMLARLVCDREFS